MTQQDEVLELLGYVFLQNARPEKAETVYAALLAWPLEIWIVRALIRLRRRMSRAPGTCRHCGYDLRATPEDQCRYPLNYASRLGADPGH